MFRTSATLFEALTTFGEPAVEVSGLEDTGWCIFTNSVGAVKRILNFVVLLSGVSNSRQY